jgi:predicted permease
MQERLVALPGVKNVAITRVLLLSGSSSSSTVSVQDDAGAKPAQHNVYMMTVSPEFFDTMEIPIAAGRQFTAQDSKTAPKVAIINETAARKLFPNGSAIGRRVGFSPEQASEFEIVGVMKDTKYNSVRNAAPPTLYQSHLQGNLRSMNFVLRTQGDPAAMIEPVRAAVRAVDPAVPITNVATQTEQVERRFAQERLFAMAYSLFGGLALLLACIGLFGLMSYTVARRTNEIGIRMALGAQRGTVVRMVLGESLLLVGIGIVIGIGSALLAGRFVETVLFGLSPMDVLSFASATILIVAVASLAGYLPARRAARVDPMVALHRQ